MATRLRVFALTAAALLAMGLASESIAQSSAPSSSPQTASPERAAELEAQGQRAEQSAQYDVGLESYRQAYAMLVQLRGPENPDTLKVMASLSQALYNAEKYSEQETLAQNLYDIDNRLYGPDDSRTLGAIPLLAAGFRAQGRAADAERLDRSLYNTDLRVRGSEDPSTYYALFNLGIDLDSLDRHAESEQIFRVLRDHDSRAYGQDDGRTLTVVGWLAQEVQDEGRSAEAEQLARSDYDASLRLKGPQDVLTLKALEQLAISISAQGRYPEAEGIVRNLYEANARIFTSNNLFLIGDVSDLAGVVGAQGRFSESERYYRQALALSERGYGRQDMRTVFMLTQIAYVFRQQSAYLESLAASRLACAGQQARAASLARTSSLGVESGLSASSNCYHGLAFALMGVARHGPGTASPYAAGVPPTIPGLIASGPAGQDTSDQALGLDADQPGPIQPADLGMEAFQASQRAIQSAAGNALSRSASGLAAAASGNGQAAADYEKALVTRDALEDAFGKLATDNSAGASTRRQEISAQIADAEAAITRLAAELAQKAPWYWDYRSPEPVSVAGLQAPGAAAAPELLHANEAIVLWLVTPGKDKGLVFAVSKDRFGWAEMGLNGDELDAKVKALRAEVDPQGQATDRPFDRKTSHELYLALLGDAAIQQVIDSAGVDTLLVVPSGSLTSLPPSLLVVDEPSGADSDPQALRSTHWLIRDKAIAVLPAVSSLRTLRVLLPQARAQSGVKADLPLLALADPDFHGDHLIPRAPAGPIVVNRSAPAAQAATADGRPKEAVLADLPPLYGTLAEGQALQTLLGAPDRDLLLGPEASKTELMARQGDGTLVRTRVVAFSTHGLVTGDFTGLTEPALALAHPPANADPSDDGLLTASQAANLKLDADWVVLSACNTASPETPGAEGLSGLARAFFYAGADSLLVSHWRVRDDAAMRIVTETFRLRQADTRLSKAQALRQSMLALLDDTSLDASPAQSFANPQAWAPFIVVGEAE